MFSRCAGLVVLGSVLLSGSAAIADEMDGPPPIVRQCVGQIQEVTESTAGAINAVALNGVQRLRQLDQNDAPVPVMVASTHAAAETIDTVAERQSGHVMSIVQRCVRVLNQAEAPDALKRVIIQAGQTSKGLIRFASVSAKSTLHRALQHALVDEDLPGDGEGEALG